MNDIQFLHVFGQFTWHDTVDIVGDRGAIKRLADALNAALESDNGTSIVPSVFVNDGEGYSIFVNVVDDETMQSMAGPYADEMARSSGLYPHDLPHRAEYPRAATP